jgi:hypothetical protein
MMNDYGAMLERKPNVAFFLHLMKNPKLVHVTEHVTFIYFHGNHRHEMDSESHKTNTCLSPRTYSR